MTRAAPAPPVACPRCTLALVEQAADGTPGECWNCTMSAELEALILWGWRFRGCATG